MFGGQAERAHRMSGAAGSLAQKGASMTFRRHDTSVRPADGLMAEAVALIDGGRRRGVQLRLTGGLAVRRYCTDLDFMDREFSDIDLIGVSRQSRELHRLFGERGYDENRYIS